MQTLYVVDLDLKSVDGDDPYDSAVVSILNWLAFMGIKSLSAADLRKDGSAELGTGRSGGARTAEWKTASTGDDQGLSLAVREDFVDETPTFITRVVLARASGTVTFRITMGRASSATWLTPSSAAQLFQPRLLRMLVENRSLALSLANQDQDGRYLQVRNLDEVRILCDSLRTVHRLPVLLVHARTLNALEAVKRASSGLVGLARIVTLDLHASRALAAELPNAAPEYAGAVLVWSNLEAPVVRISPEQVNNDDPDALRAGLMNQLAPLSVLARGQQTPFNSIHRAQLAMHEVAARERSEEARRAGDLETENAALRDRLATAHQSATEWQELAESEEQRAAALEIEAGKVPGLEDEIRRLKYRVNTASSDPAAPDPAPDDWSDLPVLVTGDQRSAEQLFLALGDVAGGKIEFTSRAATSWKKSSYPNPDEMTEDLITLARAASALYDGTERQMGHLDNWFRDEFHLKVALQDDTIEKASNLRYFQHDGQTYDRTPHVKVADHTTPDRVGRIHFALDAENKRLIVDHVALKLYR